MCVHVGATTQDVQAAVAKYIADAATQAIQTSGRFGIAFSGGSLPKIACPLLCEEPLRSTVDWSKVHVFFADERWVDLTHADSNYLLLKEQLLDRVPIPATNVHTIAVPVSSTSVVDGAAAYQTDLQQYFNTQDTATFPQLDMILLGMGPDGHTASLFPNHPLLKEGGKWVASIEDSPKMPPQRFTLTLPLINAARNVGFVAVGDGKAEMLKDILENDSIPPADLPCKLIKPTAQPAEWFVDAPAARLLSNL